ncbi:NXPE family member 1-like [Saccoglossus kowalevskii]
MGVTNVSYSVVDMLSNASNVYIGDIIHLDIYAKDSHGRQRVLGGDYWRAMMVNRKMEAATLGKIVDHDNGSYSIRFYAAWSGRADIEISLIHTREAVRFLRKEYQGIGVVHWKAVYANDSLNETVTCILKREGSWDKMCEIRRKEFGRTILLCDVPKQLTCSDMQYFHSGPNVYDEYIFNDYQKELFAKSEASIQNITLNIKDSTQRNGNVETAFYIDDKLQHRKHLLSDGVWFNGSWYSYWQENRNFDRFSSLKCLSNFTNVYLLGDSTTRQWFLSLNQFLGIKYDDITWDPHFKPNSCNDKIQTRGLSKHGHLTLQFFFHPFPLGQLCFVPQSYMVEDDVIRIATCRSVIVFGLWAHYLMWTEDSFEERLQYVKASLWHFYQRCPESRIIVRGSHVLSDGQWRKNMANSDVLLLDLNRIIKKVFNVEWVHFLDTWDLNRAYLHTHEVHMPNSVVAEEIKLLLSYICVTN